MRRAASTMSHKQAASRASGSKNHLPSTKNLMATKRVSQPRFPDEIDRPPDQATQFVLDFNKIEQRGSRLGIKVHQHIHIAVRTEILPKHGTKERQLSNLPLSTERRNSFFRHINLNFSVHDLP